MRRKWRELAFVAGEQYRLGARWLRRGFHTRWRKNFIREDAASGAPLVPQDELKRAPAI